jgi:glycosyltransferase involved in cell wall biosynthesis
MHACIENGKTGIISQSRRPEDFADAILQITALTGEERQNQAIYAAKRVRDLFTVDRQRKQWLNFFQTLN